MLRGKSKERSGTRKVTPPEPTYMNNDQFASFLANLRDNRVNRPTGSRPQPMSAASSIRKESDRITPGRPSISRASVHSELAPSNSQIRSDSPKAWSSRPSIAGSVTSRYSTMTGRDYYPEKASPVKPLKPDEVVPTATYMERGSRWMEKEEAFSLRTAMEDMDIKDKLKSESSDDDETRLYNAALDEAADLVWQHQNGVKPPEPGAPYRYKSHMRKNSYAHARTASVGKYGGDIIATGLARDGSRSVSGSSTGSEGRPSIDSPRMSMDGQRMTSADSTKTKTYGSLNSRPTHHRRRSSMKRNISGEIQRPFSGDQIWEEPEGETPKVKLTAKPAEVGTQPPRLKLRHPPNNAQVTDELDSSKPEKTAAPQLPNLKPQMPVSKIEIHRNPPSQSRNPNYTTNSQKPMGPRVNDTVAKKNGVEIRGDDIRQATSFTLGDRSKKLPTPSAVSDRPGRPIVSFDANWKAPEEAATDRMPEPKEEPKEEPSRRFPGRVPGVVEQKIPNNQPQQLKSGSQIPSHPPVPTISLPPTVQAPIPPPTQARPASYAPPIPSISVDEPADTRPIPNIPVLSVTSDDGPSIPTIVLPGGDEDESGAAGPGIPVIVTPDDAGKDKGKSASASSSSARPLPTPTRSGQPHARNARGGSRSHWSPAPGAVSSRATATCHECSFPIEGRVVALRGTPERFHPQCFVCYTCGTSLEALEISPEPDSFRKARLGRIAARAAGEQLPEEPGQTMAEDGDARLRFYCHLDWHELFAPRCKTCTTPIIGEHVVALGGLHFHYGHFFCAECGDPFGRGDTHIEKDGYAWCVSCQSRRTERRAPKCKRCKKPVIGQYVQALGGEWHDECFRCGACGGGFDDGQIFPVGDGIRCTDCRMRELKA
ncbi:hypothetical protein BX600DRAFT_507539 [Xylariales sp. PMI_506]|nr:hypothetical protein BX600DRAFT_507539 [Xylariales sp. PMI_506]